VYSHSFTWWMLAGFARSGLARWRHRTVRAGGETIEVNYMAVTAAGRLPVTSTRRRPVCFEHGRSALQQPDLLNLGGRRRHLGARSQLWSHKAGTSWLPIF
jgi:hypothetical protein